MTERAIRLVAAGAGEVLDVLGAPMVVKADPATMGLLLVEHEVPPGYAVPPHVHDAEDEVFQVLAGTLTFVTDAGEARGGPGATMLLPTSPWADQWNPCDGQSAAANYSDPPHRDPPESVARHRLPPDTE